MQKILIKKDPVFLENQDFKTILIKVMFPYEEKEEDIAKFAVLPSLLNSYCDKYPTEDEFYKMKDKLHILFLRCGNQVIGTTGCLSFHMVIPDTYTFEEDVLEEQFSFMNEVIYHPLIRENAFPEKELEREKRSIYNSLDNAVRNMRSYQDIQLRKLMDDEGILSRDLIQHRKELEDLTGEELYQFYQQYITNNQPAIYIMGNVDKDRITSLSKKYLYLKNFKEKEFIPHFYYYLKPRKKVIEVEEESTFKDSSLSYTYRIRDMKKEDKVTLSVVKDLLSSLSSRLLQQKLRNEMDLIYSSSVVTYSNFGVFEITVFIHKDHVEKTKKAIVEVLEDLKKEEVISPLIENIKKRNKANLLRELDDKYFLIDDFARKDLGVDDSLEEFYQKVDKVTAKDVKEILDRMVLDVIYFLKEGENE